MGETPGCPYKGNVQLEYGACDVKCGKYIFLLFRCSRLCSILFSILYSSLGSNLCRIQFLLTCLVFSVVYSVTTGVV